LIDQVNNLLARYCHVVDRGTTAEVLELYAKDAMLVANGERHGGHAEIGSFYEGYFALCEELAVWVRHRLSSPLVELGDEGTAECVSYVDAQSLWRDRRLMNTVVQFDDTVERANDSGWQFRTRTLTTVAVFEVARADS
jgi:hypothetical protein